MNNELSIKLFRLATGDDIISAFVEDIESNSVILQHPMKLVFRRIPTGATILAMMPWLPSELIKVDAACIDLAEIVTILELKDDMVDYYLNIVEKFLLSTENSEEIFRERLLGAMDHSELDNLEQVMEEKTNSVIH
jgi:hypothetical protein